MHNNYYFSKKLKKIFQISKNKIVIKSSKKIYYYKDLFNAACKISYIIKKKVNKNELILIVASKDFYTIASIFACIFSGNPYSVIDTSMPNERLKKIFKMCNAKFILTSKNHTYFFENIEIIRVKNIINKTKKNKDLVNEIENIPDKQTCYVMFTSGSTGFPKGAMISRDSLLRFSELCKQNFLLNKNDNLTGLNPIYFDNSIFDIFASILNGLKLTLFTEKDLKNPNNIFKTIKKNKPTVWFSTPSLLVYLLNMKILNKKNILPIKKIIFGGEAFPINKLRELHEIDKEKILFNVYGPTETTCICSSYRIKKKDIYKPNSDYVTIGKIWKTFKYYLTKNKKKMKHSKNFGELYLFGPNVGLGYVNDRLQTKKSFIQNSKRKNLYSRGYKTGDLFHEEKKNKYLFFKGRKDNQIKVMGHRIELSEIESAMNNIKNVEEVAVFAKKTNETNKIIAVVSGKKIYSNKYVYENIRIKLPKYMIPSNIFLTKKMLKNANGKIDRVKIKKIYETKTII